MMSRMPFNYYLWKAHRVRLRKALNAIITLVMNTRISNVGRGIPSSPVDSTHGWETSVVACHYRPWTAHTVGQHRASPAIIELGQHSQLNDFRHGMSA